MTQVEIKAQQAKVNNIRGSVNEAARTNPEDRDEINRRLGDLEREEKILDEMNRELWGI